MYTSAQRNRIRRAIMPVDQPTTGGPYPSHSNVQGDVYSGFAKGGESFIFFRISDKTKFKQWLKNFRPTTALDVKNYLDSIYKMKRDGGTERIEMAQFQIAFSRAGLDFLGQNEKVGDFHFDKGPQHLDKALMDDQGTWDDIFLNASAERNKPLHCVLIVSGDSPQTRDKNVESKGDEIIGFIENPPTVVGGKERQGDVRGHEHFGYKDGISQPALIGLTADKDTPDIQKRDAGIIVMGYKGDPMLGKRPAWTKDGSLMVFRKLEQAVPEFEKYKRESGKKWREFIPKGYENVTLTDEEGAALFGAQIFGRWTSGLPLQKYPIRDDKALAKTISKVDLNDFDFSVDGDYSAPTDLRCPFFSHIRKTVPRQLEPFISRKFLDSTSIVRSGLPYGPEVTASEMQSGKSSTALSRRRGLLFVCYQSSIANGFIAQTKFGGNDHFPFTEARSPKHGQDPIIGSPPRLIDIKNREEKVIITKNLRGVEEHIFPPIGFVINDYDKDPRQPFFVTSRGGENFFVPSVSELQRMANL